jgi:adenine-specific DNA-methyltransferase
MKFYTRSNVKGVDESVADNIVWFAKDINQAKIRPLFIGKASKTVDVRYRYIELPDGSYRSLTKNEIEGKTDLPMNSKRFSISMLSSKSGGRTSFFPYEYKKQIFYPQTGRFWSTTKKGLDNLAKSNRLHIEGKNLKYKLYLDDFGLSPLSNIWNDTVRIHEGNLYTVQTGELTIARCLFMTTDPGDLVFDPTCGSGTTAYVAEQWGRRWITCDTSRVATTLAKQRLMTALFGYYKLAQPDEGIGSGFKYNTVQHVTLKSIANNEPPGEETLYDKPYVDKSKARVTGPFTVEAVPAPMVKPLSEIEEAPASDESVTRSGETLRQHEWRSELLKTGIRGKGGQRIEFSRVEPLPATRWLHADAETKDGTPQRAVVSFGPEHAPLEQRQVALAIEEAQNLVPKPKIIVFASL